MYKNYIFDLYGTLVDINTDEWSDSFWRKIAYLFGYKGAHYTPEELHSEYDRLVALEKENVLKKHPEIKVPDFKAERVFKKLFEKKGVKTTKAQLNHIGETFRCCSTNYIKLFDGITDLLDTLKAKGKKIYLLSNAQRIYTENELRLLDLMKYFDGVLISSDEECSKPDVNYFQILFDRYGLKKSESIMIGNDYKSDIDGAADFGIDSLYIYQESQMMPKPDESDVRTDKLIMDGNVYKIKELIVK